MEKSVSISTGSGSAGGFDDVIFSATPFLHQSAGL